MRTGREEIRRVRIKWQKTENHKQSIFIKMWLKRDDKWWKSDCKWFWMMHKSWKMMGIDECRQKLDEMQENGID